MPQAIAVASLSSAMPCVIANTAIPNSEKTSTNLSQIKSAAILGGKLSKLDQMRLTQSGQAAGQAKIAPAALRGVASFQTSGLVQACNTRSSTRSGTSFIRSSVQQQNIGAGDFLASKRLRISRTVFDPEWNRVQRRGLGRATVAKYLGSSISGASEATLARVNEWTNHRVRYVEDRDLYGLGDYWANAGTTLRRGAGDCEDIAIVKMQLLAALGVPRSDMFLTVARDLARNADHAMLVVKLGDTYWLLDNATDKLLDGTMSHDYRPIMSFSTTGKWLHGYAQS